MLKAVMLILLPAQTWQKIASARRSVAFVFLISLLPLILLSSSAEAWGLIRWGDRQGGIGQVIAIHQSAALKFEAAQGLLDLALLFGGALFVHWVAEGFHIRSKYSACFRLTAYALTPFYLLRFLNGLPLWNHWANWAIAAGLLVYVLYHGVGLVLEPDQTKGFGLYLVIVMVLLILTGTTHLMAVTLLQRRINLGAL